MDESRRGDIFAVAFVVWMASNYGKRRHPAACSYSPLIDLSSQ